MGDFKQRRLAAAPRVLHPSEDLSELPPLRSVVAGQVYHYRLAGSSQNSLPKLLPAGWVRSSPYWAVFIQQSCTGGLRASAKSLFHFWLIRLMSCQSLDMYFSSCMRACSKNTSHPLSVFEALLHQTFFTLSKNSAIWPKFGSFYCALSWMMCQVSGRLLVHCIHRRKAYK